MIADLPPLQATEPQCRRTGHSPTRCRPVQHTNGTIQFVLVVCKAYDYGVVSTRNTFFVLYNAWLLRVLFICCVFNGKMWIPNYALLLSHATFNSPKLVWYEIWGIAHHRTCSACLVAGGWRWMAPWMSQRATEVVGRAGRKAARPDLLLSLLVVYNEVSLFWCRFTTRQITRIHVWISRNRLRK